MTHTTTLRVFSWRKVESSTVPDFQNTAYRQMIAAIRDSEAGPTVGLPPEHVLAFVFALVVVRVLVLE